MQESRGATFTVPHRDIALGEWANLQNGFLVRAYITTSRATFQEPSS